MTEHQFGPAFGNVALHLSLEYFHNLANTLNIYWVENIEFGNILCARLVSQYGYMLHHISQVPLDLQSYTSNKTIQPYG